MKDLEWVEINLELIAIQKISEKKYKLLCKEKVKFKAFEEMTDKETKCDLKTIFFITSWKWHHIYRKMTLSILLKNDNFCFNVE